MKWILPALMATALWGVWSFIPKITTRYLSPSSAIVYESMGGAVIAIAALLVLRGKVDIHPVGTPLALITGLVGLLGAFFFLRAVSSGPISLIAPLSALYPIIPILLANRLLNEALTLQQGIGIALGLVSIVLITARG